MSEPMAYVGVEPCGCIRAVTVDNPDHAKDVRRNVLEFLRFGTVERMSVEKARVALCFDKHGTKNNVCPHPNACPHRTKEPADA